MGGGIRGWGGPFRDLERFYKGSIKDTFCGSIYGVRSTISFLGFRVSDAGFL